MWKQRECTEMCLCMNTPWSVRQERSNTVYQTHACLRLLYVTAIIFTLIAILNHQNSNIKRSWFALSSRENVVCISYSGGMFWRYIQSVFHTGELFIQLCCINLKQEVEKTQKSAEAGCLKLLSLPNFFFFTVTLKTHREYLFSPPSLL